MATGKKNGAGQPIPSSACSPSLFKLSSVAPPIFHLGKDSGERKEEAKSRLKDSAEGETEARRRDDKIAPEENWEMFTG